MHHLTHHLTSLEECDLVIQKRSPQNYSDQNLPQFEIHNCTHMPVIMVQLSSALLNTGTIDADVASHCFSQQASPQFVSTGVHIKVEQHYSMRLTFQHGISPVTLCQILERFDLFVKQIEHIKLKCNMYYLINNTLETLYIYESLCQKGVKPIKQ